MGYNIVGLQFIEKNLTEELCLDILENSTGLTVTEIVEANPQEVDLDILFQHYGTPPHYSRQIRIFRQQFPGRCIGHRGPT